MKNIWKIFFLWSCSFVIYTWYNCLKVLFQSYFSALLEPQRLGKFLKIIHCRVHVFDYGFTSSFSLVSTFEFKCLCRGTWSFHFVCIRTTRIVPNIKSPSIFMNLFHYKLFCFHIETAQDIFLKCKMIFLYSRGTFVNCNILMWRPFLKADHLEEEKRLFKLNETFYVDIFTRRKQTHFYLSTVIFGQWISRLRKQLTEKLINSQTCLCIQLVAPRQRNAFFK